MHWSKTDTLSGPTTLCTGFLVTKNDELIGQPTRTLFLDQESYEAFGRTLYKSIDEGQSYTGIIPQKRKDGMAGWYEFNISALSGHPEIAVGAIVDRTASHKAIEELEHSKSLYQSVVEDQTEVISRIFPDDTFVFVNDVFCRLFGKSRDELIGQRWQTIAHPDDLLMIEAKLREITLKCPVVTIENRVFLANGEMRWMQFVNRGLFDATGTLKQIQSVGRDISTLKQTELQLRESDQRLELALQVSELLIWDWDIPNHQVTAGNGWFELLGYSLEELGYDEDRWMNLIHPDDFENYNQRLALHLQGEIASFESKHRLRHKQGHWVSVEAKGKVVMRDKAFNPLRMIGTTLDVTLRRRLQDESMGLLKRIESLIGQSGASQSANTEETEAVDCLTKRQREILGMIAAGMTSAEIAEQLHLATKTVISHRQTLMAKLNLHNTAEITRFGIHHNLLASK